MVSMPSVAPRIQRPSERFPCGIGQHISRLTAFRRASQYILTKTANLFILRKLSLYISTSDVETFVRLPFSGDLEFVESA